MGLALGSLIDAVADLPDVEVLWLYGSSARDEATAASDVDLAVAFDAPSREPWERVDALRAAVQARLDRPVSVIDINRVPTPLAYEVVRDGRVLVCRDDLRLRAEERRIWSLWDAYRGAHEEAEPCHEAYVLAIRQQVAQHAASLDELAAILHERPSTFIERTATERG